MRVSIIRVSRDTGVYYYPPWGDANSAYNTVATRYLSTCMYGYSYSNKQL